MIPTKSTKLTYDDYCLIPEDGNRHEIIDGVHYMAPAPYVRHQEILGNLYKQLLFYLEEFRAGKVYVSPIDIVLSESHIVQPDIVFISNDHADKITKRNILGPPDLVIEILSQGTRRHDKETKRTLYEKFNVREYWIVDPEAETVQVYRQGEHGFTGIKTLNRDSRAALNSSVLQGFACDLEKIFR